MHFICGAADRDTFTLPVPAETPPRVCTCLRGPVWVLDSCRGGDSWGSWIFRLHLFLRLTRRPATGATSGNSSDRGHTEKRLHVCEREAESSGSKNTSFLEEKGRKNGLFLGKTALAGSKMSSKVLCLEPKHVLNCSLGCKSMQKCSLSSKNVYQIVLWEAKIPKSVLRAAKTSESGLYGAKNRPNCFVRSQNMHSSALLGAKICKSPF